MVIKSYWDDVSGADKSNPKGVEVQRNCSVRLLNIDGALNCTPHETVKKVLFNESVYNSIFR